MEEILNQTVSIEKLIETIFDKKKVHDEAGNSYDLGSNVDIEEGKFLYNLIKDNNFNNTIEIGCCYGISSMFICNALKNSIKPHHTIIDPFQKKDWHNIGMCNLKRVGIDFHELIEVPSEIALPKLLSENKTYDFAFIDGWHTFDHTLIDFFYLNRMLKIGGIIVIDDVSYPSVSKLMRYLMRYPCYKMVGNIQIEISTKKKLFEFLIRQPLSLISRLFPKRIQQELFSGKVIANDSTLGLNASMIAFKKIKEDERPWYWFEDF